MQTFLIEMSAGECERQLRTSVLGRLGVVVKGRPEIFPVNHVYDETTGGVLFPTDQRTKWSAALDWPWVAFEIDELEPDRSGGWSVAVVGHAEEVTDPGVISRLESRRAVAWATGPGTRWLRIRPEKVTGLRVRTSQEQEVSPGAPA